MPTTAVEAQPRRTRLTGWLYLTNIVVAGIASVHVLPRLIVPGDAAATAANITDAEWMLHLAVAGDLVAMLLDVALSALLYVLLRPLGRTLALAMAAFRLTFTVLVLANVQHLVTPLRLLAGDAGDAGDADLGGIPAGELAAQAMLSLDAYRDGYATALFVFGAHVVLLGFILYRSAYVPRLLGAWLTIASVGYFAYGLGSVAVPGVEAPLLLVAPAGIAELVLCLLLLFNRVNVRPADRRPAGRRPHPAQG